MTTLTITAKGQVTLRKDLLNYLGVGPGEKIEVDKLPDGRIMVKAATQTGRISDFIGCLSPHTRETLTIDDIKEITAEGWSGQKRNKRKKKKAVNK